MKKRALVIGAGIGGVCAVSVLSPYFEEVIIIEKDKLPDEPILRPSVPQGKHLHQLLVSGYDHLSEILKGWDDEADSYGCTLIDFGTQYALYSSQGRVYSSPSHLKSRSMTRPLYEHLLRKKALSNAKILLKDNSRVVEFIFSEGKEKIVGLKIQQNDKAEVTESLFADVVVDAGGRGFKTFEMPGYASVIPEIEFIPTDLAYTSSRIRLKRSYDWKILALSNRPPENLRSGAILSVENGTHIVTLSGYGEQSPPTEKEAFLKFAEQLEHPQIFEALKDAEFLSDIQIIKSMPNRRYRVDKLKKWPQGLLLLGDSLCTLNPFHGQGMSVAVTEAHELARNLAQQNSKIAFDLKLQQKIYAKTQLAWTLATTQKRSSEKKQTKSSRGGWLKKKYKRYLKNIFEGSAYSPILRDQFLDIIHLKRGRNSVFRPQILAEVFRVKRLIKSK